MPPEDNTNILGTDWTKGFTQLNAPQFSGSTSGMFSDLTKPTSDFLTGAVGYSSETPLGNESAQNTAQASKDKSNALMDAFKSVQDLYQPHGGRAIAGSEDIRVKSDVYGRPYTVVSMTPTDEQGRSQKKETLSFGVDKSAPSQGGWKGPHSWEEGSSEYKPAQVNTFAQSGEYEKRKKAAMAGQYGSTII